MKRLIIENLILLLVWYLSNLEIILLEVGFDKEKIVGFGFFDFFIVFRICEYFEVMFFIWEF